MTKFSNYILTVRKKDGMVLCHCYGHPAMELKETEDTVDVMLTEDEFYFLQATKSLKNAIAMVDSIKWKIKYWGGVDV